MNMLSVGRRGIVGIIKEKLVEFWGCNLRMIKYVIEIKVYNIIKEIVVGFILFVFII